MRNSKRATGGKKPKKKISSRDRRQSLLRCVHVGAEQQTITHEFLEIIADDKKVSDGTNLKETVSEYSEEEKDVLWADAHLYCTHLLLQLTPEHTPEEQSQAIECLKGIVMLMNHCVSDHSTPETYVPHGLTSCLLTLHDFLSSIQEKWPKLGSEIVSICEKWWSLSFPNRQKMISNALIYLLEKAIEKSSPSYVKRLWNLKEAFYTLKLDEPNPAMQSIRELLHQSLACSPFLKPEGRKFLALLFEFDSVNVIHEKIKQQLPKCPKVKVADYADVYHRAWKCERIRKDIELCLQNYIYLAVNVAEPTAGTLRHLIEHFSNMKGVRLIETMLCEMSRPILWRAIDAINSKVRLNAAKMLFLLFPLRNLESKEENAQLYEQQLNAITKLLDDPCPSIRQTSASGVSRVLSVYWNTLSLEFLRNTLRFLSTQLAFDKTSPDVRCAVVQGFGRILEQCAVSPPAMEKLLPRLLPSALFDASDKVRFQAVKVLLQLRGIKVIKFWKLVTLDVIFARLAIEPSKQICNTIVELLFPSYCPLAKSLDVRLARTAALIEQNSEAARKFYTYAHKYMQTEDAAEQIRIMMHSVYACVELSRQRAETSESNSSSISEGIEEDQENAAPISPQITDATDKTLMSGLIDCAAILFRAIVNDLQDAKNVRFRVKLYRFVGRALPTVLSYFKDDDRIVDGLYEIGSLLPETHIKYTCKSVLNKLQEPDDGAFSECRGRGLVQVASAWRFGELIEIITQWIDSSWTKPIAKRKTSAMKGKTVKFTAVQQTGPKASQGLRYLEWLMENPASRLRLLKGEMHLLPAVVDKLERGKEILVDYLQDEEKLNDFSCVEPTLFPLCLRIQCLIKLVTLSKLEEDERKSTCDWFRRLVQWTSEELLEIPIENLSENQAACWLATVRVVLEFSSHALLVGLFSSELVEQVSGILDKILLSHEFNVFMSPAAWLLLQLTEACIYSTEWSDTPTIVFPLVERLFRRLGRMMQNNQDLQCWTTVHKLVVRLCLRSPPVVRDKCVQSLLFVFAVVITSELTAGNRKDQTIEDPREWAFEPPAMVSALLKHILWKESQIADRVAEAVCEYLQNLDGDDDLIYRYGAGAQTMHLLAKGKVPSTVVEECRLRLRRQLELVDKQIKETQECKETINLL